MKKERLDCLVIIHKIELRTLLLGVNGYYNLLISTFYKQLSKLHKYKQFKRGKNMLCNYLFKY
jgi:hypothetical protein